MGIPALVGAGIGGVMSSARGGNPLQGALLGGLTGGIGGSVFNLAQTAAGAPMATELGKQIAEQSALSYGGAQTLAGQAMTNPALMGVIKQLPSALGTYAQQNPFMAMQGLQMASNMMEPGAPMQAPQAMPMQTRGLQDAPIGGILAQQMQRQPISLI